MMQLSQNLLGNKSVTNEIATFQTAVLQQNASSIAQLIIIFNNIVLQNSKMKHK